MIKSIRGRLQWWYGAVYALSIIVFGTLVYWRADRDVHERATLQAVTTAQYLDVSLRNLRPGALRSSDQMSSEPGHNGPEPGGMGPEFDLGQLPPEFQFRPLRGGPPGRGPDGRGPDGRGPDRRGPDGRGPDGPNRRGPMGPPGPPEDRVAAIGPPNVMTGEDSRGPRDRMDRLEFAIWRSDGSILRQSDGFDANTARPIPAGEQLGSLSDVVMVNGVVDVFKRGPQGVFIQVLRPIEHDMAKLHRFGFQIAAMAFGTLAVGLVGGWWISGRIVKPIRMISDTAAQISATSLNRRIETASLDAELIQLGEMLNSTFGRLEQSFGRLTQFTADASHELRTPLAVIQSQVELALSQPRTSESYQQTLEVCLKSSERMRHLIDGLLLLARTDSDRMELRPVTIDLRSVAEDAVVQIQEKASSAGVELECITPESATLVLGDPRFLAQVPTNLIDNAIQHSSNGGKIVVEVRLEDSGAVLTVKDAGCGIPAEHLPHIFERFYRVDTGRSRKHGGCGLGLAICHSLVEAHGGTISCESTVGQGSTFCVRLPLATGAASTSSVNVNSGERNVL